MVQPDVDGIVSRDAEAEKDVDSNKLQRMRFEVEQIDDDATATELLPQSKRNSASLSQGNVSTAQSQNSLGTSSIISTQEEMSRRGILTAIGDAGSILGSSVLLSSPSYLSIKTQIEGSVTELANRAPKAEYLDAIFENPEYIDTLEGKLPLAEAARIIARDSNQHTNLFSDYHIQKTKRQSYKKLVCIGASFTCVFACFFSLRNLQSSSTGNNQALGLVTFGCLYSLTWFGGLCANPIIQKVKPKWGLVIATVPFMLYPVANFYPAAYTLIPCALMASFGHGLLWNSGGVYVMNIASIYSFVSKKPLIEVIGKFNSVVFSMYQTSHLIGNLFSSLLLSEKYSLFRNHATGAANTINSSYNTTITGLLSSASDGITPTKTATPYSTTTTTSTTTTQTDSICGMEYYTAAAAGQSATTTREVEPRQMMLFLGVMTSFSFIGFLILALILRPLKTARTAGGRGLAGNAKHFLKMFVKPKCVLLIPFMMYPGLSGSLAMADYTKAYITCAYGIEYIGYILMAGAVFSVSGALFSGRTVHLTGRIPMFLIVTATSASSIIAMLVWQPTPGSLQPVAFIPVCLWCFGDGVLLTQINGFLGEMFKVDLVFALSMMHMCFGIGSALGTVAMAYSWMTLNQKMYWVMIHLLFSTVLFIILEMSLRKERRLK